ncbi:MAG: protein kinase [Candidatus Velthaea sp.]
MTDLAGRTLAGRYRVEALIGSGGMADVYRGVDTTLERPVAVKILTDRSDPVLRRFLREAQSMAKLNHRNIVAVYDAGQADGLSYIIMELVSGRTLAQIPADHLTIHAAIRYFIELLEALAYAHDQNIIHRDIKPTNVMVTDDGTIKVMDFGLSRRTSEMSSETNAGEIVGTIAYLAPERFLGKVADARSDLYSVGVVMYEVFTGRVPFKSPTDDLVAVIFAHVNDVPASLRTINRAIPPQIDRIVLRLLEKNPELRYQTARELIAELKALIGGPAPSPGPRNLAGIEGPPRRTSGMTIEESVRNALDRTFGSTTTLNAGYASTLSGMLASRKRDYPEATRTYRLALRAFKEIGNELEYAKTTLKYAAMILQKSSEMQRPDRKEIEESIRQLGIAILDLRARGMLKELEEAERVSAALRRIVLRLR